VHWLSLAEHLAAMAASLGDLDAVVFTGGAGEASWRLREDGAPTWSSSAWPRIGTPTSTAPATGSYCRPGRQ